MTGKIRRIIDKHIRIEKLRVPIGNDLALNPGELQFIRAVGHNEGVNINTLGSILSVTRSAASQMAGKLVKKGLVKKQAPPHNKKETLIFLTPMGKDAFKVHEEFHQRHFNELLNRLDDFSDAQIVTAVMVLSVVEGIMDERMAELFNF